MPIPSVPTTHRDLPHYSDNPDEPVYFYGGEFSSFAKRRIVLPPAWQNAPADATPVTYTCREDYYQAAKAKDPVNHDWVLCGMRPRYQTAGVTGIVKIEPNTWKVKQRGNRVDLRPDWEHVKYKIMLDCIRAELDQHPRLVPFLLGTGGRLIAEDSPTDFVWGIRDGNGGLGGRNLLGLAWMHARQELLQPGEDLTNWVQQMYMLGHIQLIDLEAVKAAVR